MKEQKSTAKKSAPKKRTTPKKSAPKKKSTPKKSTMKQVGREGILKRLKNKRVARLEVRLKKLSLVAD